MKRKEKGKFFLIGNIVGETFVRELDMSKMTIRLVNKVDPKGDSEEHTITKLSDDTLKTLTKILVSGCI